MFCPKCGQQAVSDSTRFCSRCGLPFGDLAEWLAGGGVLAVREEGAPPVSESPRRKGVRRGAKMIFISAVLTPIFFAFAIMVDNPVPLLVPFTIFLAGLSLMLYSRLFFSEDTPPARSKRARPSRLGTTLDNTALPPASNISMNGVGGRRVRTAELAQPPSVTEHTTRLLDKE